MRIRIIGIFLLFVQAIIGQKPVVLSDYIYEVGISDFQIYYFSDPTCRIEPKDVFSPDYPIEFKIFDLPDTTSAILKDIPGSCFWFRLIFTNRSIARDAQFSFHLQPNEFSEFNEYE